MEIQSIHIHLSGPCSISVAATSSDLFTVGGDSRVTKHIFQKGKIESSEVANLTYEPVYSVSSKSRKRCYIACTDNVIRSHELDSFDFNEVVMKTTQPIHCLAISHDSNYLAVATKDSKIDIINLDTREIAFSLIGHQGGVHFIDFDFSDQYLSSIGADGTIRIWNVKDAKCLTAKPYLDKEFVSRLSTSWCQSGQLVIPCGTQLDIIQSGSWTSLQTLPTKFNHRVELVAFSPNGLYIAYITVDDDCYYLCVMDMRASSEVYSKVLNYNEFNCIQWTEDGRSVLVLSKEVFLLRYEVVPSNLLSGVQSLTEELPVAHIQVDDESDDDVVIRRHLRPKEPKESKESEEPGEPEEPEDPREPRDPPSSHGRNFVDLDDEEANLPDQEEGIPTDEPLGFAEERVSINTRLHPMFMPAASEMVQDRCFLAYNEVGLIVKRLEGTESVVEVEFMDASRKRVILRDPSDMVVGSLSEEGVVLGGVSEDESGRVTGVVLYRPFRSWTSRASWRIELPGNELPDLVACTNSTVFVYTSKGFLRSWHVSGVQRSILSPCNHVVTMVGHQNTLAVVYEDSYPLHNVHNLKWILYATAPFRRLYQGPLPLSPHSTLSWIGFSKEGLVATYDSQCVIRLFTGTEAPVETVSLKEMEWVIFMNLKHIMKERCAAGEAIPYCWLVALSIKSIKYIYLPSAAVPVPTLPRPLISVMEVDIPLCNKSNPAYPNEKSTLLMGYEVSAKSLSAEWEEEQGSLLMEFDKMLLRQLNVELGNNQLLKAEYICSLMHSITALKKAAFLAQKVESSSLVNRIEEMIDGKSEEHDETPSYKQESSFENRIQQNELKRERTMSQPVSKRVDIEESSRSFRKPAFESPVQKSLLGQIHSVISPSKKRN